VVIPAGSRAPLALVVGAGGGAERAVFGLPCGSFPQRNEGRGAIDTASAPSARHLATSAAPTDAAGDDQSHLSAAFPRRQPSLHGCDGLGNATTSCD